MNQTLVLRAISSMATKAVLSQLSQSFRSLSGIQVEIESVGGVDAAKRIEQGEPFDMVLLASDAIARLKASGAVLADSPHDWVQSEIAMAIPLGAARPEINDEASLKAAVTSCPSISYSTGPSGVYLEKLFERWGVLESIKTRLVVPPPGVPVGSLLAKGEVALGFQQMSELISLSGIEIVGHLPQDVAYITTFSAAIPRVANQAPERLAATQAFFQHLSSEATHEVKRAHGMTPLV
jgi:molybdate transport system substrate-binding protein